MNQRIPLSMLVIASLIGLIGVSAIQIPQTAYSGQSWCFTIGKQGDPGFWECLYRSLEDCNNARNAAIAQGKQVTSVCFKD